MTTNRFYFLGTLLLHLLGTAAPIVVANPSHKTLDTPLAIHGKQTSVAWHQEASRLYAESSKKLLGFLEKEQKNALKNIDPDDVGKTFLMLVRIDRAGEWLEMWGEPAGADFRLRSAVMRAHLNRIILAIQPFPPAQKYIENFRLFIAKTTPARAKALANIEKLCNEKKWDAAEEALFKVYDTLQPGTAILASVESQPIYAPFAQVYGAIHASMSQLRSAAAAQELGKAIQELTPNYDAALQEMGQATQGLAASGSVTWRGETVNGPQLVESLGQSWREIQVQAQQHRAKTWALQFRSQAHGMSMGGPTDLDPNANDPLAATYATFSQQVRLALVRLVEADAARINLDAVRSEYVSYLRALAPLVRQTNDREWAVQLQAALGKLHGKVPELDQEVQGYAAATNDLLRWRARVARARVAVRAAEYAPISQRLRDGTMSGKVNDAEYIGLIPAPPARETQPQLLTGSPDIMAVAVPRLLGQKATVQDVVRMAADSKTAIGRYASRTYVNVPAPLPVTAEVESLRADLFVSEQAPPLTLAAMQAWLTAERGDFVAVGGEISGCYLESVVTRFATLPVSAAVLSTLGQLPPERFDGNRLQNMLMRFEITPRWASHDHFFVDLVPPPTQAASR